MLGDDVVTVARRPLVIGLDLDCTPLDWPDSQSGPKGDDGGDIAFIVRRTATRRSSRPSTLTPSLSPAPGMLGLPPESLASSNLVLLQADGSKQRLIVRRLDSCHPRPFSRGCVLSNVTSHAEPHTSPSTVRHSCEQRRRIRPHVPCTLGYMSPLSRCPSVDARHHNSMPATTPLRVWAARLGRAPSGKACPSDDQGGGEGGERINGPWTSMRLSSLSITTHTPPSRLLQQSIVIRDNDSSSRSPSATALPHDT